jgi:hypothetical protein
MSDTNTQPADNIIATTPEPVQDSWQENISKRFKAPEIPKVDYNEVDKAPEGIEEIPEMSSDDFLKHLDGTSDNSGPIEDEPVEEKKTKKEDKKSLADLSIDDLDLSKDEDPIVEEKPKKKSKEDNIAELRKKAETYELEAKSKEEKLAEYQRKLEELEGTLEKTAFEKSPKFKEKFQAPYEQAIQNAVNFASEIAEDPRVAERALSLKGKERIEFIDESFGGGAAAAQFLSLINEADAKRGALDGAIENYKQTNQTLVQEEEKSRQQINEKINRNFDRVANHLGTKSEFFRMGDDEDGNKAVQQRIAAAKNIVMGTASENDMAVAPFLAVIAKDAVEKLAKVEAELAKYKTRAKADASVQPRISRSSTDDESSSKPKSGLDSIRAQLKGL